MRNRFLIGVISVVAQAILHIILVVATISRHGSVSTWWRQALVQMRFERGITLRNNAVDALGNGDTGVDTYRVVPFAPRADPRIGALARPIPVSRSRFRVALNLEDHFGSNHPAGFIFVHRRNDIS